MEVIRSRLFCGIMDHKRAILPDTLRVDRKKTVMSRRFNMEWIELYSDVDGSEQLSYVVPMEALDQLLHPNYEQVEREQQKWLRSKVQQALCEKYGDCPAQGILQRFQWELERIEHLNMAGEVLFLRVHEAGGETFIGGTWGSSFLVYLLGITELNPLPPELDSEGFDLCPMSLLGTDKPQTFAEIHLPGKLIPLIKEKTEQLYGKRMMELYCAAINLEDAVETQDTLNQCYPPTELEALGAFCQEIRQHREPVSYNPDWPWLYLVPEEKNLSAIPAVLSGSEDAVWLVTDHPMWLSHVPSIHLADGLVQSALNLCAQRTGVRSNEIPLDDEKLYALLCKVFENHEAESPVAKACKTVGLEVDGYLSEVFRIMNVGDIHSLSRMISLAHGTAVWFGNQQQMIENGSMNPAQLITCREDVYRYLMRCGAAHTEALSFMQDVGRGDICRKGYTDLQLNVLKECQIEDWFIQVCKKIDYLFPEAHCVQLAANLVQLIWYIQQDPEAIPIVLNAYDAYLEVCNAYSDVDE